MKNSYAGVWVTETSHLSAKFPLDSASTTALH